MGNQIAVADSTSNNAMADRLIPLTHLECLAIHLFMETIIFDGGKLPHVPFQGIVMAY